MLGEPFDPSVVSDDYLQVNAYDSMPRGAERPLVTLTDLCQAVNKPLPQGAETADPTSQGLNGYEGKSDYNAYCFLFRANYFTPS